MSSDDSSGSLLFMYEHVQLASSGVIGRGCLSKSQIWAVNRRFHAAKEHVAIPQKLILDLIGRG
jgi:hypothetical protein